ncbi:flagellar basal body rod C-terminal domain-containing protein [Ectothiorhodospira lacustris]|uniref:flagellar basal body rod C-terminal domain-containing protein n=1 Tax=Ectothiorhodospira lacustris TaxID=2899127 RepID=UPI001EE89556|nr:hypothetical protein [Ectothiorhodospira lacustris]MCG5499391.1 hypothetical protein [Ectothiorhodospira lacustris]MCG5511304.1 hypothetical protein [Ectothiorhodospira lacustris]MCG5523032.1 hypothetical protein [Ectothiorhodospira lacustris]
MVITTASYSALSGIHTGMQGLRGNAAEIAGAGQMNGTAQRSLMEPLVEQIQHATQVEASVKVLQTEDRMLGTLINVKA